MRAKIVSRSMDRLVANLHVERGRTSLISSTGGAEAIELDRVAPVARPYLKWTGGKQWLAAVAPALLPAKFSGRYFEPFLGGASVFFALGLKPAVLADLNAELISAYEGVRDTPQEVIRLLRRYPYDRQFFDEMRAARPRLPHTRAARLIYLNKTAFNGMYRVNLSGRFNVPFGRYKNPTICDAERIRNASVALKGATLTVQDFEAATARAKRGDLAYFDPPYITGHQNNGFLKYNAPLFSWADQKRLAKLAVTLRERGVHVVVSNGDHPDVVALYSGFHRYVVVRNSLIGGSGSERGEVSEALLTSSVLRGVPTQRI